MNERRHQTHQQQQQQQQQHPQKPTSTGGNSNANRRKNPHKNHSLMNANANANANANTNTNANANANTNAIHVQSTSLPETIGILFSLLFRNKYGLVLMNASLLAFLVYLVTTNPNSSNNYNYSIGGDSSGIVSRSGIVSGSSSGSNTGSSSRSSSGTTTTITGTGSTAGATTTKSSTTNTQAQAQAQAQERDDNDNDNDASLGNGTTATVMAMATGYGLLDYQRYVGSLRKTGFDGNIILAVAPTIDRESESYLASKNVVLHKVRYVECSHPVVPKEKQGGGNSHDKELVTCLHPYPKLKHRWARFPLLRDYLLDCGGAEDPRSKCGGPVLISDMRDTIFQRNPFGPEAPKIHGLQLFAEHYTIRTTHWLVDWPVYDCKGIRFDEPMLCSGTTIGTRDAMLDYLEIFHNEMNTWMESPRCCCFETNGDDQSMHNYLFYSNALDGVAGGAEAVKNRNGLVHTVGAQASLVFQTHDRNQKLLRTALGDPARPVERSHHASFDLSEGEDAGDGRRNWLGLHYGMTDHEGYLVDFDGSRSFVVHQYDRFGPAYTDWLDANRDAIYYG